MIDIIIDSSVMEGLASERNTTIDLKKYIERSENIINNAYQKYSVTLSDFSSTSSQALQDDKFKADINISDNIDEIKHSAFKVVFRMVSGLQALYIIKKPNDFNLTITLMSRNSTFIQKTKEELPDYLLDS
jgi:RNA-binding protein YlmH